MEDSVLEKYVKAPVERRPVVPDDDDGLDDLGSFGWLRGVRDRAIMLELRHKDGHIAAFSYHWLERADFDPSGGITLIFMGRPVKIAGRNLNAEIRPNVCLFNGILRHRVPWVKEADEPAAILAEKGAVVIEAIELK